VTPTAMPRCSEAADETQIPLIPPLQHRPDCPRRPNPIQPGKQSEPKPAHSIRIVRLRWQRRRVEHFHIEPAASLLDSLYRNVLLNQRRHNRPCPAWAVAGFSFRKLTVNAVRLSHPQS